MPAKINIIGQTFGRGKVIREAPNRIAPNGASMRYSVLLCRCGVEYIADNGNLRKGRIKSCGCLQGENRFTSRTTHGYTKGRKMPRIYQVWAGMHKRCNNPKEKCFKNYGGRGITVCKEWENFAHFLKDMGEGKKGWMLERIDNDKGYCLQNCCWATNKHQARNTRRNVRYTVQGITGCIAELTERFGLKSSTVLSRIYKLKWSADRTFLTPVRRRIIRVV